MLCEITDNVLETVKIIADNMIASRPEKEVEYTTFKLTDVYRDTKALGPRVVMLDKLYPEAENGEAAFVGTNLKAADDCEIFLNTEGALKVWFEDELILNSLDNSHENIRTKIMLKKGINKLLLMCRKTDNNFSFKFMPCVRIYYMWAKDYIAHVRALCPLSEYAAEDGIAVSKLLKTEDEFDGSFVYPKAPKEENVICLKNDSENAASYALTYALKDTTLSLSGACEISVYVNQKKILDYSEIVLCRGDEILIKSKGRSDITFGKGADIGIPFLKSARSCKPKWLILNSVLSENEPLEIRFQKPYKAVGGKTFWKLCEDDGYIRPYLETYFYSQWFYALMVGHYGLLDAYKATGEEMYRDYFISSMTNISKYFEYMEYECDIFGDSTFLQKSHDLDNLDEIGTMGMCLSELYFINRDRQTQKLLKKLIGCAMNNVPRFDDGTFRRPETMWADDTYMSCPFIVRMGKLSGDKRYYSEVISQFKGFKKRLYMPDEKLFSHIFFTDKSAPNKIPWGRGNGWVYNSLSDVLVNLPKDTEGYDFLLELFVDFTEGIIKCQDADGLWHQVLNRSDSYSETSASGMFLMGLSRGINNGWLPVSYKKYADLAYKGLISKKIDEKGNVYDVCMGSSCSDKAEYYMRLGTIDNDDHGTGIILSAFAEYSKL